jgi:hypothetical protein
VICWGLILEFLLRVERFPALGWFWGVVPGGRLGGDAGRTRPEDFPGSDSEFLFMRQNGCFFGWENGLFFQSAAQSAAETRFGFLSHAMVPDRWRKILLASSGKKSWLSNRRSTSQSETESHGCPRIAQVLVLRDSGNRLFGRFPEPGGTAGSGY